MISNSNIEKLQTMADVLADLKELSENRVKTLEDMKRIMDDDEVIIGIASEDQQNARNFLNSVTKAQSALKTLEAKLKDCKQQNLCNGCDISGWYLDSNGIPQREAAGA